MVVKKGKFEGNVPHMVDIVIVVGVHKRSLPPPSKDSSRM